LSGTKVQYENRKLEMKAWIEDEKEEKRRRARKSYSRPTRHFFPFNRVTCNRMTKSLSILSIYKSYQ
jgi:hypothetical protein